MFRVQRRLGRVVALVERRVKRIRRNRFSFSLRKLIFVCGGKQLALGISKEVIQFLGEISFDDDDGSPASGQALGNLILLKCAVQYLISFLWFKHFRTLWNFYGFILLGSPPQILVRKLPWCLDESPLQWSLPRSQVALLPFDVSNRCIFSKHRDTFGFCASDRCCHSSP